MPPNDPPGQAPMRRWRLNFEFLTLLFILLVAVMLIIWRPWQASVKGSERTVSVTGDTKLTAEPDEFVFSPQYDFKNADKQAALTAMSNKNNEIVAKLKSLGVPDSKIKNTGSGYSNGIYFVQEGSGDSTTYSLMLTITANSRDQAQKVQDYLLTTSPTGAVTPEASFSEAKRKSLEATARDQASKDARSKATQSAKNLGFKVGKVKSIDDSGGFGGPIPLGRANAAQLQSGAASGTSLAIQPGQNDLEYSVTVVYYIN